ncbi:glycerol-3-phosphate responsive antiterminator [Lacticaseibacillus hegangensis]|uniref:Glycerol uptake operon antiterminator regulatory protein n=1 Tax=Lacticaseibacillus hegangensis TaxID=2486010 RepID=A0ABW4D0L1_9LACO|nr:glycerol-3-phosphate responsive antiterminator [Lacticaseibacillus hegangensis]
MDKNLHCIIPSVVNLKFLDQACRTPSSIIFLTGCNIGNLQAVVRRVHKAHKLAFVHLEFLSGFKADHEGLNLLHTMFNCDGVVSTNIRSLSLAKKIGLQTIFRLFLVDSVSYERSKSALKDETFTAIELLPAINAVAQFPLIWTSGLKAPLIAGGFIRTQNMISNVWNAGFDYLDTSQPDLWIPASKDFLTNKEVEEDVL